MAKKQKTHFGKWVGGVIGWAAGGPVGGIIGFAVGHLFDQAEVTVSNTTGGSGGYGYGTYNPNTAAGDFAASLLVLSAAVMKSDGRTMKSELEYVKRFYVQQFGEDMAREMIPALKEILERDIPLEEVCMQVRRYMPEPHRMQLIHYLFGLSKADGEVHQQEVEIITRIAQYMGVSRADFESTKAMYFRDVMGDYKILELESTATDEEVKKAYRKMAVKYHPDKVADLGEDAQRAAKEQFQKVQEAYENIKKTRGMS